MADISSVVARADPLGRQQQPFYKEYRKVVPPFAKLVHVALAVSNKKWRLPLFALDYQQAGQQQQRRQDNVRLGATCFVVASYDSFWDNYRRLLPKERLFYEIILHEQPCHLYVDVDMNRALNPGVDEARLERDFLAECTDFLIELGFAATCEEIRIITLDSSNAQKLSRHFIIKCARSCFANNFDCGAFMRRLRNRMMHKHGMNPEKNRFFFKDTEKRRGGNGSSSSSSSSSGTAAAASVERVEVRRFYADLAVYTTRRNMRLLYSSKAKNPDRPLLLKGHVAGSPLSKRDFEDCLVQRVSEPDKTVPRECTEEDGSKARNTNSLTLFRPDVPALASAAGKSSASVSLDSALLKTHYEGTYPFDSVFKLFGCKGREWVFQGRGGHWQRYLCFDSAAELKQLALEHLPAVIHIGPVYAPTRDTTDRRIVTSRELVFDIDLNDYGKLRGCCGAEKKACAKCWKYAQFCVRVLDRFLCDYGFRRVLFVFSGAKGLHCWVCDTSARTLSREARETIVCDLRIAEMDLNTDMRPEGATLPPKRAYVREALNDLGGTAACKRFLREDQGLRVQFDMLASDWGDEAAVLHFMWPRIDADVTTGMSHPTKSPFALNPKSGKTSFVIRNDADENPFIPDDGDDNDNNSDQVGQSALLFEQFVAKACE